MAEIRFCRDLRRSTASLHHFLGEKTSVSQRQRNMAVVLILGVFYYYRTSHLLQINSTLTKEKKHSIIQRHAPPFGLHVHTGKIHKLLECAEVFVN